MCLPHQLRAGPPCSLPEPSMSKWPQAARPSQPKAAVMSRSIQLPPEIPVPMLPLKWLLASGKTCFNRALTIQPPTGRALIIMMRRSHHFDESNSDFPVLLHFHDKSNFIQPRKRCIRRRVRQRRRQRQRRGRRYGRHCGQYRLLNRI